MDGVSTRIDERHEVIGNRLTLFLFLAGLPFLEMCLHVGSDSQTDEDAYPKQFAGTTCPHAVEFQGSNLVVVRCVHEVPPFQTRRRRSAVAFAGYRNIEHDLICDESCSVFRIMSWSGSELTS